MDVTVLRRLIGSRPITSQDHGPQGFGVKFFDILESIKLLDASLFIDHIFSITKFFGWSESQCGRVTIQFLNFLKQLRAHGGCLGSERR